MFLPNAIENLNELKSHSSAIAAVGAKVTSPTKLKEGETKFRDKVFPDSERSFFVPELPLTLVQYPVREFHEK